MKHELLLRPLLLGCLLAGVSSAADPCLSWHFEDGPAGWKVWGTSRHMEGARDTVTVVADNPHGGGKCLRISDTFTNGNPYAVFVVPVDPAHAPSRSDPRLPLRAPRPGRRPRMAGQPLARRRGIFPAGFQNARPGLRPRLLEMEALLHRPPERRNAAARPLVPSRRPRRQAWLRAGRHRQPRPAVAGRARGLGSLRLPRQMLQGPRHLHRTRFPQRPLGRHPPGRRRLRGRRRIRAGPPRMVGLPSEAARTRQGLGEAAPHPSERLHRHAPRRRARRGDDDAGERAIGLLRLEGALQSDAARDPRHLHPALQRLAAGEVREPIGTGKGLAGNGRRILATGG